MKQQLVLSQTICMEQNERYGREADFPKLFGFVSAFKTIIELPINDAHQDWSYEDKILAWLAPEAFKIDIEAFYKDKARCLSELFKKYQLKTLDLSLCKLLHHRITIHIFNGLLPLYKQLLSDEQKYSEIIPQLNSAKYANKQNTQIFIKHLENKLFDIEERADKKSTEVDDAINLFMRSFCLSTNETTRLDGKIIDTYRTSSAVDKLTNFLKIDTEIEFLIKERNSKLNQKVNSRTICNIDIRKLTRDIDSLQSKLVRMMREIFYFFYQIKPEQPPIKDISRGNEKFKIPGVRNTVISKTSLLPKLKYINPPESNKLILNKPSVPQNNCMDECVLEKSDGGKNDFLSMSLVDLVNHSPVSIRLRNAIVKAANLEKLPFKNIGDYLSEGINARLAINELPNVGQIISRELDELIKKVSQHNYHKRLVISDQEPINFKHFDYLKKLNRPLEHITNAMWISWVRQLTEDHARLLISDIAQKIQLPWPWARGRETFSQYINLSLPDIKKIKSFGIRKIKTVVLCVAWLAFNGGGADNDNNLPAVESTADKLAHPPNDIDLLLLPVFSSKKINDFSLSDLNPAYRPFTKLADFDLPARITHILRNMGMQTIGEVMLTQAADFLSEQNFGFKSIQELQDIVRSHCLLTTGRTTAIQVNDLPAIDYSNYEGMVFSFIAQCEKNERNQQLFFKKFCFQEDKPPTLEELGCQSEITRERVRQILIKGIKKLQKKVNVEKIAFFWNRLDRIVDHGGGVINLGDLPTALQNEFHWQTAPNSLALGQFLLLRQSDMILKNNEDRFRVECECPDCEQPRQLIHSLDFKTNESFHIQVIAAKLSNKCQTMCPCHLPAKNFHRAFIEDIVDKSSEELIAHNNLVMPYDKWRYKYRKNLGDAICSVLEAHGSPMHFREIADSLRRTNKKFIAIADHNVHAAVMRYEIIEITGRGTYGLKSWGLGGYRPVTAAIEEFIDAQRVPQLKQDILKHLRGEFSDANINASLTVETRFTNIGASFYDRTQNWRQRSCREFIQLLPDQLAEFARYLISRNNTSYKLVMAFIFIRSMDAHCTIYIHKLKDMFYNYYLLRHKKSLPVEVDSTIMHRIAELPVNETKNKACSEPLKSFINSGFFSQFSQDGRKLALTNALVPELSNIKVKNILVITLLKAIDDYFRGIPSGTPYPLHERQTHNVVTEPPPPENKTPEASENESSTISIRKKGRGKIKL